MTRPVVVHVITRLELGGAQQNTLDTCRLLDRERFACALISGPDGHLDSEAARIEDLDFRIVKDLVRPVAPERDVRAHRAIKGHLAELAREAPIIVHTHSSKAGIVGRLAARGAGVKRVVHTVHGFGHPAFRNPVMRRVAIAAERHVARMTSRFVAVSQANIDEGRALRLFGDAPVELIRSGFDLDEFANPGVTREEARARLDLPADAPVVGTVACLKAQKAPLDFVAAAAAVHRSRPDVHFVIAGDGELRPDVERARDEAGLGDRLHLLGWRDDVPVVLRALDLFWLTSRWEGLPRAVVQAMAARVPVIATAVDGTQDVVRDDETGLSIAPGDTGAFATRTVELLGDAARRDRLTTNASRQLPQFDVHEMVRRLEGLYDALAALP